jgi:predicted lipoprotein
MQMANVHTLPMEPATIEANDATCTAESIAAQRMRSLIDECSLGGRRQLTEARDQIDDLMRALDQRGEMLLAAVTEFAGFVQQAVEMKKVIMGPIENLAGEVSAGLSPIPWRTVTHTAKAQNEQNEQTR